jgi:3-methyladenine DNA glycosylase/8-oxoguanine DNA glycosylase
LRSGQRAVLTSSKVPVKSPCDFALYPKLCLGNHDGPLPFSWSGNIWSSLIEIEEGRSVPVQVISESRARKSFLRLVVHRDVSTEELANLTVSVSKAFCTKLDLVSFYNASATDPILGFVTNNLNGLRPQLSVSLYEGLIKAIARQLVRASYAREIISLLVRNFGTKEINHSGVFYGFPTPSTLASATKSQLLRCKLGFKWQTVRQISRDVALGDLSLDDLPKRNNEDIVSILEGYKGIGYWTSRIFLYDSLKRLEAYPILDISLKRAISELYFSGRPIAWSQVRLFFDLWKDFTGILVTYLFGYLWLKRFAAVPSN